MSGAFSNEKPRETSEKIRRTEIFVSGTLLPIQVEETDEAESGRSTSTVTSVNAACESGIMWQRSYKLFSVACFSLSGIAQRYV